MVQEIFIAVSIKAVYLLKVLVSSYNDDSENSQDDQNYENDDKTVTHHLKSTSLAPCSLSPTHALGDYWSIAVDFTSVLKLDVISGDMAQLP